MLWNFIPIISDGGFRRVVMTGETDLVQFAAEIAEIARITTDPAMGEKLIRLAGRLLAEARLPDAGGGDPPSHWFSVPADCPEYA
jgi:hypothetical protein